MAQSSSFRKSDSSGCSISEDVEVITMVDVLKEEQELEDCTKALLGACDDKNCTYSKGYVKRQALYACVTCQGTSKLQPSGVCLACSYHCHEGHELIELYTKRNFRCDCGNSKFPDHRCNLELNKAETNELNKYNQNFRGVYCFCKKPYPDPDNETNDAMFQCIICEDWYHEKHLELPTPLQLNSGELICGPCMKKNKFLASYAVFSDLKLSDGNCILSTMKSLGAGETAQALVFPDDWRKKLCKCEVCMALYNENGLKFLLDEQDTVHAYEEQGKADHETQYERGMKALSSMDRVQQVEAIKEYNDMKSQLMEYLQKFAESKKVVREEDIKEFFNGMEARKKQRVDVPNIPYFCR